MSSGSGPSSWLRTFAKGSAGQTHLPTPAGLELTLQRLTVSEVDNADPGLDIPPTSQPLLIPSKSNAAQLAISGSAGLPSALATPPAVSVSGQQFLIVQQLGNSGQQEQEVLQQPGSIGFSAKGSKGVRWLPSLQAAPESRSYTPDDLAAGAAMLQPRNGNTSGPDGEGGGAQIQQQLQGTHTAISPSGSSTSSSRTAPLPSSNDVPLDNYLRYLLQEQHPHKFMYYEGYGMTVDGCAAVGEFLRRDKRIKVVTLSGNGITDEGIELIAEGLAHNSCLLRLDLSNNLISSVGAIELAEALHSTKCQVAELLLSNNRIGDDGADALAAAAASSSTLKRLKLSGNSVSAAQLDVVQHVLKTRDYKLKPQHASNSKASTHMRKVSSNLQFDIELMEGQSRSSSSKSLLAGHHFAQLPPALAVAALIEPKDPQESSIAMQAARLLAELHDVQAAMSSDGTQAAAADAQPGSPSTAASEPTAPEASRESSPGNAASQPSLAVMLAVRLACRGYDVVLRTCFPALGPEPGPKDPAAQDNTQGSDLLAAGLRHTFVLVSQHMPADEAVVLPTVIVDPLFRDQFVMPHPTQRLQEALDAVPRVLCLAEARLFHLVDRLCTETAAAFEAARLSLPPWRHTPAVMDKWLSEKHHDVVVDAESSPQALEKALQATAWL